MLYEREASYKMSRLILTILFQLLNFVLFSPRKLYFQSTGSLHATGSTKPLILLRLDNEYQVIVVPTLGHQQIMEVAPLTISADVTFP